MPQKDRIVSAANSGAHGPEFGRRLETCERCHGSRRVGRSDKPCPQCRGNGEVLCYFLHKK